MSEHKQIRLTPAAQRDLSDIWDYSDEARGRAQADKYLREIKFALDRLAQDHDLGRERAEIRSEYKSYDVGRHVVFFTLSASTLDVIRILHQRMDFETHL